MVPCVSTRTSSPCLARRRKTTAALLAVEHRAGLSASNGVARASATAASVGAVSLTSAAMRHPTASKMPNKILLEPVSVNAIPVEHVEDSSSERAVAEAALDSAVAPFSSPAKRPER